MTWTHFNDAHTGGQLKTDYEHIYIEEDNMKKAVDKFWDKFQTNPNKTSCSCCGQDFRINTFDTLKEATKYARTSFGKSESLSEHRDNENVLIIRDTHSNAVNVNINGDDLSDISIEIDGEYDPDRVARVARTHIEGVIGDTISEGPQPKWAQQIEAFEDPDWEIHELETAVESEIEKHCGPNNER